MTDYVDLVPPHIADAIRPKSRMYSDEALRIAIERLVELGTPRDLEAATMLQDIWWQRGLEDYGVDSGRLVDFIDTAVRG